MAFDSWAWFIAAPSLLLLGLCVLFRRGIYHILTDSTVRREWRMYALFRIGRWVLPSYRFIWPQLDWWHDEWFNAYLVRFGEIHGQNTPRRFMVHQLAALVQAIPGDTAECGVLGGSTSYLICTALPGRHHFMFDSFEGCSKPTSTDGDYWSPHDLTCALETARQNLGEFNDISFHQGWIPERFSDVGPDRRFCFVHIDVQLYQPTRDSFEFFYPRMSLGGIIVCDDYGFTTCPGATQAVDEFLCGKPERMIRLDSGSGFLVKRY